MRRIPYSQMRLLIGQAVCEFVLVPAGPFWMGTAADRAPVVTTQFPDVQVAWILKEAPAHEVDLPEYYISRTPITNAVWAEYAHGVDLPAYAAEPSLEPNHPVCGVTYEEAEAFCRWLSRVSGHSMDLPTEAQWEKAARGTDGREWPWGDDFSPRKCNTREGGYGGITPVDRFPEGASPYGVLDMGGNLEEWTRDLYLPYPGAEAVTDGFGGPGQYRVTRGGHWQGGGDLARCARRHGHWADSPVGVRVVLKIAEREAALLC